MTEEFRPERGQAPETGPWWFTLLLVYYGLYYTVNMYTYIRLLFLLHRCVDCSFSNSFCHGGVQ